jgi:RNA polymerase sigma-70 factor (ECF subfamily)
MSDDISDEQGPTTDRLNGLIASVARELDPQAFGALFSHFAPRLKGYVMRRGADPETAEEVVQETMVNVWRRAGQFDPDKASAATWVFTIARNLRIDMLRKARRPEPDMSDPALEPDPQLQPMEVIARAQEARRLHERLTALPAEQKIVLEKAFFEDKSHTQVAEELGLPLGTVKSRIRLAMSRVRSELGEKA